MLLPLAPLTFILMWSIFIYSSALMVKLVTLLMSSLVLPFLFMSNSKVFWPCGMLMILMSTGLIVIFTYMVSLYVCEASGSNSVKYLYSLGVLSCLMMFVSKDSLPESFIMMSKGIEVSPSLSLTLIWLLLFLVVCFVRIAYSKGGGFRKKF